VEEVAPVSAATDNFVAPLPRILVSEVVAGETRGPHKNVHFGKPTEDTQFGQRVSASDLPYLVASWV